MFNVSVLNCLILIKVKHCKKRSKPIASKMKASKKRKGVAVREELAYQRRRISGRRFPLLGWNAGVVFAPFQTETGIDFADSGLESGVVVIVFERTMGV